jgi:hypothetical protein
VEIELFAACSTLGAISQDLRERQKDFDEVLSRAGPGDESQLLDEAHEALIEEGRRPSDLLLVGIDEGLVAPLTTNRWRDHQAGLSMLLREGDWEIVSEAYKRIAELAPIERELRSARMLPNWGDAPRIERALDVARDALVAFHEYARRRELDTRPLL